MLNFSSTGEISKALHFFFKNFVIIPHIRESTISRRGESAMMWSIKSASKMGDMTCKE